MQLEERINAFIALGKFLGQFSHGLVSKKPDIPSNESFHDGMIRQLELTKNHNGWFTSENLTFACKSWSEALSETNVRRWVSKYDLSETSVNNERIIAIIMAGNVPLVGFHDFISVLISGNKVLAKLSSKDKQLLPFLADYLMFVEPKFKNYVSFTEDRLTNFDAVIATGSNNTARYFDYYFGKYPHLIRHNRNSVAVLGGNESPQQMKDLADDIFRYFGLGCRNVSKIYFPAGYDIDKFFEGMYSWKGIINNNKYVNNYDYNKAVYLMSNFELLDNEFLLLKEDKSLSSPIAVIFYEYYSDLESLKNKLVAEEKNLQCIVSQAGIDNEVAFGKSQSPMLWDYADGIDILEFLLKL